MTQALGLVRRGGTVVLVGMPAAGATARSPSETSPGAGSGSSAATWARPARRGRPRLVARYQEGRLELDELITARYPLERINEAIARWKAARRSGTSSSSPPPTRRNPRPGPRRPPGAHAARALLPRPGDLGARAGAAVRPPLGLCGARRPVPTPRAATGPCASATRACSWSGTRTGVLRAFLNVCRHRGAQLCPAAEGQTRTPPVPLSRLDLRSRRPPPAAPRGSRTRRRSIAARSGSSAWPSRPGKGSCG